MKQINHSRRTHHTWLSKAALLRCSLWILFALSAPLWVTFPVFANEKTLEQQIMDESVEVSIIRDQLNELEPRERGDIFLSVATKVFSVNNPVAQGRLASVGCKAKGWSLPDKKAKKLQDFLLEYSRRLAQEKMDFDFRFSSCAALSRVKNQRGIYFDVITNRNKNMATAVCSGEQPDFSDSSKVIADHKQVLELFDYEKEARSTDHYFNYYPLALKFRMAVLYGQAAGQAESDNEKTKNLKKAVDIFQDVLDDPKRLQHTRHGWRLYPTFLAYRMIYGAALGQENSITQLKILDKLGQKKRKLCAPPFNEDDKSSCQMIGYWPTARETHKGEFGYLQDHFSDDRLPFAQVKILDKELTGADGIPKLDSAYVSKVNVDRFFPGAQSEMADECKGWKRRIYDPNQVVHQASSCIEERKSLQEFDACLNELEAKDWTIQFATFNKSQSRAAGDLAQDLNETFKKEPFSIYFSGATNRKVITGGRAVGGIIVYTDGPNFSTSQITELKRLMDGDFLKKHRLPVPLFIRPPQR